MTENFYVKQLEPLAGGKIVGFVIDEESSDFGEAFFGLRVRKASGEEVALWILRDDEGNGPGSFSIDPMESDEPDHVTATSVLGNKVQTLLRRAVKVHGSYAEEDVMYQIEEDLTIREIFAVKAFLSWIRRKQMTFGHNIPIVVAQFGLSDEWGVLVREGKV